MAKINRHADDYGLSAYASNTILKLVEEGKLDSTSYMPNMSCFDDIKKDVDVLLQHHTFLTVHLNFVEGKCVADPKDIPHLAYANGLLSSSWGTLFKYNYNPFVRSNVKKELKIEIKAQIEKIMSLLDVKEIAIDSHQHSHMIPIIFESLIEVIEENNYKVNYIRVAKEPLGPYLSTYKLYRTYKPINFIKNFILNWYSLKVDRYCRKQNYEPMYVWGLVMSGKMDKERINILMPKMQKVAAKKGRMIEMIFHPGALDESEVDNEFSHKHDLDFYLSNNRKIEEETLQQLEKYEK